MAALPYMQLYVADYLADTAHLTTEQHGAYLLLLMNYWQRGKALVNSNERLANVARMSNERWNENRATLAEFFEVTETEWIHHRVERDLEAVRLKSDKARSAGKLSLNGRRTNARTNAQRTTNHTDTDTEQIQNRTESKETVVSLPVRETDASLGARMLCEIIGDRDVRNERAYCDAIKTAVNLGKDARDEAQRMVARWNEYQSAKSNLEWGYGSAYKFFMSGMWDKPDQWAWEKGKRPQTKAKKYAEMPGREA